jgi:peptidoglycan/xylan/chitin deacetylase (PgdA/CDA1 family)
MKPFFTISLDFELLWGVHDVFTKEQYGKNILGGRAAIPKILQLFKKYNIHATWASVGLLTFSNKVELQSYLPDILPNYKNPKLDVYKYIRAIGRDENSDPYHYAYSLICQIQDAENMEIASHTFSHYYCLEEQYNSNAFLSDLQASNAAFSRLGIHTTSLVFPRNQYNSSVIADISKAGFTVFRGNEDNYLYQPRADNFNNKIVRGCRLLDSYTSLTGVNSSNKKVYKDNIISIPSSRFLRPARSGGFESLRLKRILKAMNHAAANNKGFHLWFHPHNFGNKTELNIAFLEKILINFEKLKDEFGMQSLTMKEAGINE